MLSEAEVAELIAATDAILATGVKDEEDVKKVLGRWGGWHLQQQDTRAARMCTRMCAQPPCMQGQLPRPTHNSRQHHPLPRAAADAR